MVANALFILFFFIGGLFRDLLHCVLHHSLLTSSHRGKSKKNKHIPLRGGRRRAQEAKLLTEIPASVYVAAAQAQAAHQQLQQKQRYQEQRIAARVRVQQNDMGR